MYGDQKRNNYFWVLCLSFIPPQRYIFGIKLKKKKVRYFLQKS